jgi:hypothetical protein
VAPPHAIEMQMPAAASSLPQESPLTTKLPSPETN